MATAKSAHLRTPQHARARHEGKRPDTGSRVAIRADRMEQSRLKVWVRPLEPTGQASRKDPGRGSRQCDDGTGAPVSGVANGPLSAATRASPRAFTALAAHCGPSAGRRRRGDKHNTSGWVAGNGASGRFEVNVKYQDQILPPGTAVSPVKDFNFFGAI